MKKIAIGTAFIFLCTLFLQASLWIQKEERLFREAKILIFDEEWEEALEKLDELIEDYPESPLYAKGLFYKATCLKELQGNEVEALNTFKEYVRINGHNRSLTEEAETSIIDLALVLYEKGRVFYLREVEDRLVHENRTIRYYAAFELSYIEDKEIAVRAVPILQRILQEEEDERLRDRAKIALLRIDPEIVEDIEEEEPYRFQARVLKISVHKIGKREPEFFISIPWSLADLVFSVIPEQSRISMRKQGVDIDKIVADLTKLKGSVFEIKDDEEGIIIRIWVE
ncbi:MAG: tetratricopeptide repeat protein [Candidatus Aminicenantes bacterium]